LDESLSSPGLEENLKHADRNAGKVCEALDLMESDSREVARLRAAEQKYQKEFDDAKTPTAKESAGEKAGRRQEKQGSRRKDPG